MFGSSRGPSSAYPAPSTWWVGRPAHPSEPASAGTVGRGPAAQAIAALVGGVAMTGGAFLPWLSLFAGLHDYPGTTGLNGWILASAGLLCAVLGMAVLASENRRLARLLGAIGGSCLLFCCWLGMGLFDTYAALRENAIMVPTLGPGLFVTAAGAILVMAVPWLGAPTQDVRSA